MTPWLTPAAKLRLVNLGSIEIYDGGWCVDAWRITSKMKLLMRRFYPHEFPDVERDNLAKHILSLYRTLIYDLTSVWAIRELRQLNSSLGVSNAI